MKINSKFQSTIDTYNRLAPQFIKHLEVKVADVEINKFLAMVPKNGRILDAGCGSCRDSALMIEKGFATQGIDASEELLKEAQKIHPEVPTQVMSLAEMTFADQIFDGIWCRATLLHIDRKDVAAVLRDFHRILKKNGALFIQTKEGDGEGTQPVPFDPTQSRFFTFFNEDELVEFITDAGFSVSEHYTYNNQDRVKKSVGQEWVVVLAKKK